MKAWKLPLSSAILAISMGAHAVEPAGIELDSGIKLLPSVELSVSDDDNVYLQPEATQEGSTITRLSPALGVEANLGQTQVRLGYKAEKGTYSADEDDNYTDQTISAGADFEMTSRHQLNLNALIKSAHDARGAGTVEGSAALAIKDPDEYDETSLGGDFIYGSESAFLNLTTSLKRYEKEYKNNFAAGTRDRDHTKTTLGAQAAFDVSSATDILVDLSTTKIEYSNDSTIADSREGTLNKFLVGASYDLTGKLTGAAKVGASQRSFEESNVDSDTALSWELNMTWNPRTYSTVTLYTAQSANETSTASSNYIDSSYSMASWEHKFSEYFALTADVSLAKDAYYNDSTDRKDETVSYGLTGVYSPTKSLDVKANVKQADRDSTTTGLDYSQQVITLGVALAI